MDDAPGTRWPWGDAADLLRRALDVLDTGMVILSVDLEQVLETNDLARQLLGGSPALPAALVDAAHSFIIARKTLPRPPAAMRIEMEGRAFYLRLVQLPGEPPAEVLLLRDEILRDADAFRILNAQYGVSHREFQVLNALRLGKTNREISVELGIAEGTTKRHLHELLARFHAPNRTRLVDMVERVLSRR